MKQLSDVVKAVEPQLKHSLPFDLAEWVQTGMRVENYHKHTSWSNLIQIDSATSTDEFMKKLDENQCQCYFSGEHGYQGEWLYIYDICNDAKKFKDLRLKQLLKFRYSTEAYWVKDRSQKDNTNCHIILIARNQTGLRKINYILSRAAEDGFYYKPRLDLELLFELTPEDVFVTSSCLAGWKYEDATELWLNMWSHFGDSFFLEYQAHHTERQRELNRKISLMASTFGIQTVVGLDTHYVSEEDRVKRENLLARKGLHYDDEDGWFMDFPTGTEILTRFREQGVLSDEEIIISMLNTHVFNFGCSEVELNKDFKIPIVGQYKGYSYDERVGLLSEILHEKYQAEETQSQERYEGLIYELEQVRDSTMADYFMTNYEIIKLATSDKYNGQLTPTSRGSASSYYTSKLLGFTTMDRFEAEVPIFPERFITQERILSSHQAPDIDYNVSNQEPFFLASRELVGENSCYPLLAVGKLGEKSGFKLYADIAGLSPSVANEITSGIDQYNEALKQVDDEEDKESISIEDFIDQQYVETFNQSKPYQGIIEQAKVHACGHLIFNGDHKDNSIVGYGDIRYEIGLIRCHSESTGKSVVVACVEGSLLDNYGYVKNDYLIVDVVGIIYSLYSKLGMRVPSVNQLRKMVDDDTQTWELYAKGSTCSLNQCEKSATTKRIMKYRPQNPKELAAFIAGIRPGFKSLLEGFLNRIEYSNGEKAIDDLLKDSFHYMLYQEAVMKIFSYLGIPMKDSYDTIKKISKKKLVGEKLAEVEANLRQHWIENIGNLDNFEPVYKVVKDSARYSFNAPHALAMAFDSLYEAWVKAHHPSVFYEVTLNHYQNKGDKDKVALLIKEAVQLFDYKMGSYEYGKDNTKFTVDDSSKTIYPNLSSVKGIGEKAVADLVSLHREGVDDFITLCGSIKGTHINNSVFKNLIKIGYFKPFGSVKYLMQVYDLYLNWRTSTGDERKTVSKDKLHELKLDLSVLEQYATDLTKSGKRSEKQYSVTDWNGLVRALSEKIHDTEFPSTVLAKFQHVILGYIDIIDPEIDKRYAVVTELNTTYSPKFKGYCINNGKIVEMKLHKSKGRGKNTVMTSFEECPVEDGDVIYLKSCNRKPKMSKVNDEWVESPDVMEWWISDYSKLDINIE